MLLSFSRSVTSSSLQPHGLQHTRLPCPSPSPGACSNLLNQLYVYIYSLPPEPPSHPHPLCVGYHKAASWAPCVTQQLPASVHMLMLLSQFVPPQLPALCLQVHFLCLSLYPCPANRFISTIFLDSICMGWCCFVTKLCPTLATLWTVAHQTPLSTGFPRQEYWSGLPFPSSGDLPDPGTKAACPTLAGRLFTAEPAEKSYIYIWSEVKWSEVPQSCPTLCDPMDCSLPGSSIHGILQARVLEWVAVCFSRRSSQPRDQTRVSRIAGRHYHLSHQGRLIYIYIYIYIYSRV